jgi:hypothetical protein
MPLPTLTQYLQGAQAAGGSVLTANITAGQTVTSLAVQATQAYAIPSGSVIAVGWLRDAAGTGGGETFVTNGVTVIGATTINVNSQVAAASHAIGDLAANIVTVPAGSYLASLANGASTGFGDYRTGPLVLVAASPGVLTLGGIRFALASHIHLRGPWRIQGNLNLLSANDISWAGFNADGSDFEIVNCAFDGTNPFTIGTWSRGFTVLGADGTSALAAGATQATLGSKNGIVAGSVIRLFGPTYSEYKTIQSMGGSGGFVATFTAPVRNNGHTNFDYMEPARITGRRYYAHDTWGDTANIAEGNDITLDSFRSERQVQVDGGGPTSPDHVDGLQLFGMSRRLKVSNATIKGNVILQATQGLAGIPDSITFDTVTQLYSDDGYAFRIPADSTTKVNASGTGVIYTSAGFTDPGAAFPTAGGGLAGLMVRVGTGASVSEAWVQSNTATAVTIGADGWSNGTPAQGSIYAINAVSNVLLKNVVSDKWRFGGVQADAAVAPAVTQQNSSFTLNGPFPVPTITSLNGSTGGTTGSAQGKAFVKIVGTGLGYVTDVQFGGVSCLGWQRISDTEIWACGPTGAQTPGTVDVTVLAFKDSSATTTWTSSTGAQTKLNYVTPTGIVPKINHVMAGITPPANLAFLASLVGYAMTGITTVTVDGSAVTAITPGNDWYVVIQLPPLTAGDHAIVATNGTGASASATLTIPSGSTVPGAPSGVTASPGNGQATVSWTAPGSTGGSPITGYTVTATPGGATATVGGGVTTANIGGLTNGTSYTFTVHATNVIGNSSESTASNAVVPQVALVQPGYSTAPRRLSLSGAGGLANNITLSYEARDGSQILFDPVSVACTVTMPGTSTAALTVVRDAIGLYHASFTPTVIGLHRYSWSIAPPAGITVTSPGGLFDVVT